MELSYGPDGLLPVIVQDALTGQVRMFAHMTREALVATLRSGLATFWSRSRGELWEKGKTSGNTLRVVSLHADCDSDALLLRAEPVGPTCHTGSPSCFFRAIDAEGRAADSGDDAVAFLEGLEREIHARKGKSAAESYTKHLLEGGPQRIGAKLREEADELARATDEESADRVASEAADVLYHLMVALASRDVPLRTVIGVLFARSGTSGHAEKSSR